MSKFTDFIRRGLTYALHGIPIKKVEANIHYLSPSSRLNGKKILITGGGRGIGYAMAKKFVEEGAEVLISGRNISALENASQEIGCKYLKYDLLDIRNNNDFLLKAEELLGKIDCLVNNAGVSLHEEDYSCVTPESFDTQISTNLKAPFFLSQKFVELLRNDGRTGHVLFISSETGITADERPYGWTKAAINSMVEGLAYKLTPYDIRVNAIAPGVVATDMTGLKSDGDLNYSGNIMGRVYLPEEIAEVACFLLSDASSCITGQVLVCNNGKTINARWK